MQLDGTVAVQSIPAGSSATATVASVLDNGQSKAAHTAVITAAGSPASGNVQLQLSHDNVNWFVAATSASIAANGVTQISVAAPGMAAQYVRAVISTVIGTGTVGVTVASA